MNDAITGFSGQDHEIVELLVEAAKGSIQSDYEKASSCRYGAFILYIKRNLTNANLNVSSAIRASKLENVHSYSAEFSRIVGMRPRDYIERQRLNLSKLILRYTQADMYVVAYSVGYKDANHFSRAYKKLFSHPPSSEPKAKADEIARVLESLRARPEVSTRDPKTSKCGLDSIGTFLRDFWEDIKELDGMQIKEYAIKNIAYIDTPHFDTLVMQSKTEYRVNAERGEELARCALDILRAIEFQRGEELLDEKILGYANLANILRMRLDLAGARKLFDLVDRLMPSNPKEKGSLYLYVNFLKGVLLWWLRDVDAFFKLTREIMPDIRSYGTYEILAKYLQLIGEVYESTGRSDLALPAFEEAIQYVDFVSDPYVVFSAHYNLAYILAKHLQGEKAAAALVKVERLYEELGPRGGSKFFLVYLRAMVARCNGDLRAAENHFVEAREGFVGLGMEIYAALTALDLALLYLDMKKPRDAYTMATNSIRSLVGLPYHKEAISALALLQEAAKVDNISRSILKKALHKLEMIRKDPVSDLGKSK